MFEKLSATIATLSEDALAPRCAQAGGLGRFGAAGIVGAVIVTMAGSVGVIVGSALTFFA